MPQHTLTFKWTNGSSQLSLSQDVVLSGDSESNKENVVIPAGAVDFIVRIAFRTAGLQSFFMLSDSFLHLWANNPTQDAFTIEPDSPFVWYVGSSFDAPFHENVTQFEVSNPNTHDAILNIRALWKN